MLNTQALTFADLTLLGGVIITVLGLWWRIETRVSGSAKEALAKAHSVEADLNKYKLEVAHNYARHDFINTEVTRLGERFDKIVEELHGIRDDFHRAMVDFAARAPRTGK